MSAVQDAWGRDPVDRDEWVRAQSIFARVVDLPQQECRASIEQQCGGDQALARLVVRLVEADRQTSLLDRGLSEFAEATLADGNADFMNRQIGPYRLIRLLGEGGMGTVYLAERTDIGGMVAIKFLRNAWTSPMRRARFLTEQRTLAKLNHPNIARLFNSGTLEDGTPWFVMEYVDGVPLTVWVVENNMAVRGRLQMFRQMCEAVQHAHQHAIIHRDLKPSNVLVTPEGEVKLLDFGIAKHLEADDQLQENTLEGLRLFTPAYAAPEQIATGTTGLFTDVFALGVLLYELLAGQLPWAQPGMDRHRAAQPPSAVAQRAAFPTAVTASASEWVDLDMLCMKALESSPTDRYGSVDAMRDDVDAFLEWRVLRARKGGTLHAMRKFIVRHLSLLATAAVGLAVVCTVSIAFLVRLARTRDEALREANRRAQIEHFTEGLFNGGDAVAGPARDVSTATLLRRGVVQAEGLAEDPQLQADLFATLGQVHQKLGQLDDANRLIEREAAQRLQLSGSRSKEYAEALIDLGLLRRDEGRVGEAEATVRQGVALETQILAPADPALEHGLWALGAVLATHGKYGESQTLLERAAQAGQRYRPRSVQYADDLSQLADVHFYDSDFAVARSLYQQALDIDRALLGKSHPSVGRQLNSLGEIDWNQGNFKASEQEFRESLAVDVAWYGSDHPDVAQDLTSLAKALDREERPAEARSLLQQALSIQERTYGHFHSRVALVLNQLGLLAYEHQEDDKAERDFTDALEIWSKVYGSSHQFVGLCYANLSSVAMDRKQYATAENWARKALDVYKASLSTNHLNVAIAEVKLGRILLREKQYKQAEPETREGYEYFSSHQTGYASYVTGARKDLIEIEGKLDHPDIVAQLQASDPGK